MVFVAIKKKKSKIKYPKNMTSEQLHAFRTDRELTNFLNKLPNKSEFIVEALEKLRSEFQYVKCPFCKGTGRYRKKKG